ncbi:hypothetical protein CP97_14716 [Aurantiacibacter atlanticus]|uniref:Uncharacterized protein n=1 Tax=Aurantiacibacter atlanticus TaxID=1648404 RepID=A0A161I9Y6_9SPHN|nr:hypothetical protein CP97_14716 [Aurantiacibacter atlanticus]
MLNAMIDPDIAKAVLRFLPYFIRKADEVLQRRNRFINSVSL